MKTLRDFSRIPALLLIFSSMPFYAAHNFGSKDIEIDEISLTRNGNYLTVAMNVGIDQLELKKDEAYVLTPMIVNETDTLKLISLGIYGRTAWYQYHRGFLKTVDPDNQISLRYNKDLEPYNYLLNADYDNWMNGSSLIVKSETFGCAGCHGVEEESEVLFVYNEEIIPEVFQPELIYQTIEIEEIKARELNGRAYIDFPVNKIVIYPDYRNNTLELGKIIATIDSVKNDPDITVTSIFIKGTASPEGPYDNNVYLAKNRTLALKDYVTNLYNFPKDFIKTDYDPVDWTGLREWLENNNLNHKEEILAIVNSDLEPFARNTKIKVNYPAEYQWLLVNVYPGLRHSDYKIEYRIRQYTTLEEIAEVMKTAPQKLSLNEMYTLAFHLEPGSPGYNEIFETAVRLYPRDETANLNAANAAISRGDYVYAQRYLLNAGESPEADYARGILAALTGDYSKSLQYLKKARNANLNNVESVMEQVEYFKKLEENKNQ